MNNAPDYAYSGTPNPADSFEPRPVDIRLDRRDGLYITWSDGRSDHLSLDILRKNCPCAACHLERQKKPETRQSATGAISLAVVPCNIDRAAEFTQARLVGNYALQITWADGHSTGIYDFRLLRALADSLIKA